MKKSRLFVFLLAMFLLASCEKAIIGDDSNDTKNENTGGNNNDDENADQDKPTDDYMTVAEAQSADIGEVIYVKGYIVASCTKSMKNADFYSPFSGSTAIILADEPVDTEDNQYDTTENLFPVCLTDYKDVRADLNLEDNPEIWNHRIYIIGVKAKYMSSPGMKQVMGYQIPE